MEFVAQLVERQFVGLVVAGSKPVKLPNMVGSSNWLELQIFILPTRVRISYRLQLLQLHSGSVALHYALRKKL